MKLYNMNLSNFATKCRIAIYDKGALVEIVPVPSNDSHSPQYRKIYPFGKVPCLDADGIIIGES
jgi:glutathione S-transferase